MLPEGWKRVPLQHVADVRTGLAKGKPTGPNSVSLPYLRVANVQDGHLSLREVKVIEVDRDQIDRYALRAGDVLMTEGGDFDKLGRGAVWDGSIEPCLHQNHVFAVRAKSGVVDPVYLSALSASDYGRAYFLSCAKRSTNLASINSSQLKAFPVLLPPTYEDQSRIGRALTVWDDAIAATERLLANCRRQKDDLMSVLLRRARGRHNANAHHAATFSSIFERVVRKNPEGNDNVLTISAQHGLISQREFFNKSVASRDLSGYTLLKRGEFAYNKSYSSGYPVGAIKPLLAYEAGVVSSLYLCFRFRDGVDADPDFFRHYFEAGMLEQEIAGIAQEGARNHGLLNVGIDDFFGLQLHVPDVQTQRRLAAILNTAEAEERSIAGQVEKLRAEKRALMADLLTGKRRIRLPAAVITP